MSDIHVSLHNELNYLGIIDGLLKNHVTIGDHLVGFGAQAGYDFAKSFPLMTSSNLSITKTIEAGIELSRAYEQVLIDIASSANETSNSAHLSAIIGLPPVNAMHLLVRGDKFDVNFQCGTVEVLHEMPVLIGSLGVVCSVMARLLNRAPGYLSMQVAVVSMAESAKQEAIDRLNAQITPPAGFLLKPINSISELSLDSFSLIGDTLPRAA